MESQRGSVALSESLSTFRTTDSSVSSSTPGCQCPPPPLPLLPQFSNKGQDEGGAKMHNADNQEHQLFTHVYAVKKNI